jgi:hypothetical protein
MPLSAYPACFEPDQVAEAREVPPVAYFPPKQPGSVGQVSPVRPLRRPLARLMMSNQNGAPSISANAVARIPRA